jgi:diaminohydroxyphosphoribosylaminopyrimidine deaminase/5-amino-6-(5-phosphoribosylamino)uracil reductase
MNFTNTQLEQWMRQCLTLAKQGQGAAVHPNPMVGCVVVDEHGSELSRGFHAGYGQAHAEADALSKLITLPENCTLIVNLEPCIHFCKTPPCAEDIIAAGNIKTVVYGLQDPNPKVAGQGIAKLQQAGINCIGPLLPDECAKLNEAFLHRIATNKPFIVSKIAQTLDGFIATSTGHSPATASGAIQWITNETSRQFVHQLRAQSDAILSTAQTVIADNAKLTVRLDKTKITAPKRIVLDRRLKLADHIETLDLFKPDALKSPLIIITSQQHINSSCAQKLKNAGAEIIGVEADETQLDLKAVMAVLTEQRLTQVLVEAGSQLNSALLKAQLINKLWLMMGNQLLGDPSGLNTLNLGPKTSMDAALMLNIQQAQLVANNLWIEATPNYP